MTKILLATAIVLLSVACFSSAAPGGGFAASGSLSAGAIKPPIYFDGGNVGVNFGGYHASAGLGGLLTGDASKGGLHAEAGTPHGQAAAAGLGGIAGEGRAEGGLYAGATSGAGQHAEAGLGGVAAGGHSSGGLYASADSGVAKTASLAGTTGFSKTFSASYGGSVGGETHYEGAPVVVQETVKPSAEVHKTYIERTVIPNYVEKTIQVPSYVEKTIRVPTVVEKKVRVEAPPTIVEKTVEAQHGTSLSGAAVSGSAYSGGIETSGASMVTGGGSVSVVEKSSPAVVHRHWAVHRKPLFGGFFAGGGLQAAGGGAGSFGGASSGGYGTGGRGAATYSFRKTANPQLINDIFNIPISTLGAVNKLVSGIIGGTSGSVSVNKHYSSY